MTTTPDYGMSSNEGNVAAKTMVDMIANFITECLEDVTNVYPEAQHPDVRNAIFADLYATIENQVL